jgi:predicted acylesterase/phospholipase RssA
VKALAIDGGGIRGLIPALVLAEIEARTGRPMATMLDLIAGTSTGAIIACALARPDPRPAAEIADIYVTDGPKIFDRSSLKIVTSADGYLDERYDDRGLVASLRRHLGTARLSDATVLTMVTAYDLVARQTLLLRSDGDDVSMVDAAHASSAAPTYFEPLRLGPRTLVDGGVAAINPALYAYAEGAGRPDLLLSLGTGELTKPLPYEKVKDWGRLEWAPVIVDVVFDAGSDAVEMQLDALMGDGYIRLQTRLEHASDALDDASPQNLANLRRDAERLIAERSADIDRACALLTA